MAVLSYNPRSFIESLRPPELHNKYPGQPELHRKSLPWKEKNLAQYGQEWLQVQHSRDRLRPQVQGQPGLRRNLEHVSENKNRSKCLNWMCWYTPDVLRTLDVLIYTCVVHTECTDAHLVCWCTLDVLIHTGCVDAHLCWCTLDVLVHTWCVDAHLICWCTLDVLMHTCCAHWICWCTLVLCTLDVLMHTHLICWCTVDVLMHTWCVDAHLVYDCTLCLLCTLDVLCTLGVLYTLGVLMQYSGSRFRMIATLNPVCTTQQIWNQPRLH